MVSATLFEFGVVMSGSGQYKLLGCRNKGLANADRNAQRLA
jgi:hypothetical protein